MTRAIGIDLGTTYTVVATIEGGRPTVIPNAEGQHLTPSVVAFARGREPLVGQPAKEWAVAEPDRTVFSIKRRMGSGYRVKVDEKEYTPQKISSLILRKVKADAENYLGERIDQAVITVPAYFNHRQRQATREAGILAGLNVLKVISEPTAAALAYGLDIEEVHTVLVWDLGGGTFDVSILELGEGIFEVKAVSGDSWLGGDDIDQRLADYLVEEYRRARGVPLPADAGTWQNLKKSAERAKIDLSSSPVTQVYIPLPDSLESKGLVISLTRKQLENLTADLLQRMAVTAQQALADAGLTPGNIDRVILVGGATRMPTVRDLVRRLTAKEPYRYIDPDEVVAKGAAIEAGMLLGLVEKAALLDVLPLSLGVETQGGLAARIIARNTPLPASGSRIFTTAADYQTAMDIHVLQGERELASENVSLGQFQLNGIPSAPRGVAKVEVAFAADVDGIIHVSAKDLLSDSEVKVKVTSTKLLDPGEIQRLVEEAQHNAAQDLEERRQVEIGIEAGNIIAAAEMALSEVEGPQADLEIQQIVQALLDLKDAVVSGVSDDIQSRSHELRDLLATLGWRRPRPSTSMPSSTHISYTANDPSPRP